MVSTDTVLIQGWRQMLAPPHSRSTLAPQTGVSTLAHSMDACGVHRKPPSSLTARPPATPPRHGSLFDEIRRRVATCVTTPTPPLVGSAARRLEPRHSPATNPPAVMPTAAAGVKDTRRPPTVTHRRGARHAADGGRHSTAARSP